MEISKGETFWCCTNPLVQGIYIRIHIYACIESIPSLRIRLYVVYNQASCGLLGGQDRGSSSSLVTGEGQKSDDLSVYVVVGCVIRACTHAPVHAEDISSEETNVKLYARPCVSMRAVAREGLYTEEELGGYAV